MAAKLCAYGVRVDMIGTCPHNPAILCAIVCPWRYHEKSRKSLDKVNSPAQQLLPLPELEKGCKPRHAVPGAICDTTARSVPSQKFHVEQHKPVGQSAMLHVEQSESEPDVERGRLAVEQKQNSSEPDGGRAMFHVEQSESDAVRHRAMFHVEQSQMAGARDKALGIERGSGAGVARDKSPGNKNESQAAGGNAKACANESDGQPAEARVKACVNESAAAGVRRAGGQAAAGVRKARGQLQIVEMYDAVSLRKLLGMSPSSFSRMVRSGVIPAPNIYFSRKRRLWSRECVEQWLKTIWRKS